MLQIDFLTESIFKSCIISTCRSECSCLLATCHAALVTLIKLFARDNVDLVWNLFAAHPHTAIPWNNSKIWMFSLCFCIILYSVLFNEMSLNYCITVNTFFERWRKWQPSFGSYIQDPSIEWWPTAQDKPA